MRASSGRDRLRTCLFRRRLLAVVVRDVNRSPAPHGVAKSDPAPRRRMRQGGSAWRPPPCACIRSVLLDIRAGRAGAGCCSQGCWDVTGGWGNRGDPPSRFRREPNGKPAGSGVCGDEIAIRIAGFLRSRSQSPHAHCTRTKPFLLGASCLFVYSLPPPRHFRPAIRPPTLLLSSLRVQSRPPSSSITFTFTAAYDDVYCCPHPRSPPRVLFAHPRRLTRQQHPHSGSGTPALHRDLLTTRVVLVFH